MGFEFLITKKNCNSPFQKRIILFRQQTQKRGTILKNLKNKLKNRVRAKKVEKMLYSSFVEQEFFKLEEILENENNWWKLLRSKKF